MSEAIRHRPARILMVDDEPEVLEGLTMILGTQGYRVVGVDSGDSALEQLESSEFELVITDLQMPGIPGREFVKTIVEKWPETPVVVLTGHGAVTTAVELMRLGAADYILKPIDPEELLIRIGRRLEDRAVREESRRLRAMLDQEKGYYGILGRDPGMREIYDIIERIAAAPSPVLIEGEPGTGKEMIAQAIHDRRVEFLEERGGGGFDRSQHPLLAVNCGAFSRTLLESQLFGHKKGSFTGAIQDQDGVFVAARHGSLFLDEITELEIDLQVKLLRALQQREVTPLGSTEAIPTFARIITATNRPILDWVRRAEFRADLYYRIHVVGIKVPPLRERRGDIPLLSAHFSESVALSYEAAPREVSPEALELFLAYPWPGNVRELLNTIERAYALGRSSGRIEPEDLPPEVREGKSLALPGMSAEPAAREEFRPLEVMMREHIVQALRLVGGVRVQAAELLGIHRNRLSRLIEKYGIDVSDS